jgi:hypothetical protein
VRVEAHAQTEENLRVFLLDAFLRSRDDLGGAWEIEDEEYVPANEGYWGRLTMRRKREP